ncbi:GtrA family protein [Sutcliffiella deserti]|uniref:GtrA family protein n=1 Tax=Sutcliffiella deserti TaxID=2875501 RepID=UPI001CC1AFD8|nr:GtrA family protein [Sutcliffiella deserti]
MRGRLNNSFIRFLLVGIINTVVGLSSMYLLLNVFHLNYWISTFVGNSIGAIVSYLLNRSFTFKSSAGHFTSFPRFIFVILICYFLSYRAGLFLTHATLTGLGYGGNQHLEENIAILIGTGLYTILNYLGQKYFVFHSNNK